MSETPANENGTTDSNKKNWVKFEEEEQARNNASGEPSFPQPATNAADKKDAVPPEREQYSGAVINPETVHVNLDRSMSRSVSQEQSGDSRSPIPSSTNSDGKPVSTLSVSSPPFQSQDARISIPSSAPKPQGMRSVDLREVANGRLSTNISTLGGTVIRQGFANGDIIVTLLPVNTKWPWITPAQFRPELVPEELMAQGLTLTVEDYVHVMEVLTNDVRFNAYNVCYKRILISWIFMAFVVLLGLLFSGVTGLTLFGLGVIWLILNAGAIFLCMWIKIKLNHNLERCMAQVNKHLLRHKIILGLDDRGKLSCHKVNLCFIYFDTSDCIKKLHEFIENEERTSQPVNREETTEDRRRREQLQARMDIEDHDIIIQGSQTTRLSRKQERAEMLYLRYSQRWAKEFVRHHLDLSIDVHDRGGTSPTLPPVPPRHCIMARCPCQYIEEHLKYKPRGKCSLKDLCFLPNFNFD